MSSTYRAFMDGYFLDLVAVVSSAASQHDLERASRQAQPRHQLLLQRRPGRAWRQNQHTRCAVLPTMEYTIQEPQQLAYGNVQT